MPEMLSVPPELLVRVTVCGALVVPTVCAAKVRLVGASVTGTAPVPESPTICVPGLPESAIATEPLIDPVSVGVKVTDSVHFADLASAPPQGLVPLPTAEKLPEAVMELIVIVPVLLLVTVTTLAAAVAPTPVEVKVSDAGLMVSGTAGPPVAVPVSPTICGVKAPLVKMSRAPLIEPLYCGVKVTVIVQLEPAASEVLQVPPVTE